MTAGELWIRRALLVSLAGGALALACAAPRPSTQPLGWGPLTPGMKAAEAQAAQRAEARARVKAERAPARPAPEHGESTTTAVVEAPATNAPPVVASAEKPAAAPVAPAALTAAAFVGDYVGEDVSTYRLEGAPERVEKDPNARITVKSPGEPTVDLVLVDSSNGKEICTLRATLDGTEAKIATGQKCFEQDGGESGASASATVTQGTATLEKARLVVNVSLDFEMRAGDRAITGTLEYHFDGAKK